MSDGFSFEYSHTRHYILIGNATLSTLSKCKQLLINIDTYVFFENLVSFGQHMKAKFAIQSQPNDYSTNMALFLGCLSTYT